MVRGGRWEDCEAGGLEDGRRSRLAMRGSFGAARGGRGP